jgi:serine/threonine protein phosphatase PrpC
MSALPPAAPMHAVQVASRSEVGARSRNEDYVQFGAVESGWYAVLADGAGGHSNGAIASDLVVRIATHELRSRAAQGTLAAAALGAIASAANDALNRQQSGLHGHQRMHATLVILWIDGVLQHALWSHVGDSRLYVLRRGRIDHVTRDDSVVQSMVDAGLLAPEQAREHPNRNQLIAALGSEEPLEPHQPDAAFPVQDGDAFLLCSDGWYDMLAVADIEATLARAASVDDWLDAMQQLVRERQRPNQDNYSAIAVWIGDPAENTRVGGP